MKTEQARDIALKSLNQSVQAIQKLLTESIYKKAQSEHHNSSLPAEHPERYANKIKRYEIVIADLLTIHWAVKMGWVTTRVKVYGTLDKRDRLYSETEEALEKAGLLWGWYFDEKNSTRYLCVDLKERR